MPRIAFPNRSCLRRDRSDALIKPEGPGNSGHYSQHCWLCLARVTASGTACCAATHVALSQRSE